MRFALTSGLKRPLPIAIALVSVAACQAQPSPTLTYSEAWANVPMASVYDGVGGRESSKSIGSATWSVVLRDGRVVSTKDASGIDWIQHANSKWSRRDEVALVSDLKPASDAWPLAAVLLFGEGIYSLFVFRPNGDCSPGFEKEALATFEKHDNGALNPARPEVRCSVPLTVNGGGGVVVVRNGEYYGWWDVERGDVNFRDYDAIGEVTYYYTDGRVCRGPESFKSWMTSGRTCEQHQQFLLETEFRPRTKGN